MNASSSRVFAIAAMDENRVIGFKQKLPWHIPEDMKRFSALTKGHAVLMGRKTYQSLPDKFRPLPERKNVVATKSGESFGAPPGVELVDSPYKFLQQCKDGSIVIPSKKVWVIGGAAIYKETMPLWDGIYLTKVKGRHEGDVYFPPFEEEFKEVGIEDFGAFSFLNYSRK